jgi:hypothetical protein
MKSQIKYIIIFYVWVLNFVPQLKEKYRLRMFEKEVTRRIFGPRERTKRECGKVYTLMSVTVCTVYTKYC